MQKANTDVRKQIADAGLTQWQVAYQAGVSSQTLYTWLRVPLNDNRKQRVLDAINDLKGEMANA